MAYGANTITKQNLTKQSSPAIELSGFSAAAGAIGTDYDFGAASRPLSDIAGASLSAVSRGYLEPYGSPAQLKITAGCVNDYVHNGSEVFKNLPVGQFLCVVVSVTEAPENPGGYDPTTVVNPQTSMLPSFTKRNMAVSFQFLTADGLSKLVMARTSAVRVLATNESGTLLPLNDTNCLCEPIPILKYALGSHYLWAITPSTYGAQYTNLALVRYRYTLRGY